MNILLFYCLDLYLLLHRFASQYIVNHIKLNSLYDILLCYVLHIFDNCIVFDNYMYLILHLFDHFKWLK
jgi:hypothetical protein